MQKSSHQPPPPAPSMTQAPMKRPTASAVLGALAVASFTAVALAYYLRSRGSLPKLVPPPAPSSAAAAAAAASTAPQPGLDKRAENKDARPANASSPAPKPRPSSAASAASAAAAAAGEDKPTTANADDRQAERNALYYSESALGSLAFKQGSYAAAEEHFGRALELIPPADQSGRMILLNNRAAVREKLADFKGVVDDTTSALLIDKAYRRALNRRARALDTLGRASDALDDYVCMSLIDGPSQDEGVDAAIQRLLQQMGKAEAEGVWKLRSQGTKLAGLPKPGFCRAFLYSFTRDQRLLHAGGAGQLELRDATDALQGLGPGSEAAGEQQYKVGRLLKSTLQLEQSAVHFEEAAKSASAKTRALALDELGTLYLLAGDAKSAREALNASGTLSESSSVLIKLAGIAIEDGDMPAGQELIERAENLASASGDVLLLGDVHFHRSQVYLVDMDLDKARECLERALAIVPDFGLAHMQLGVVLFRLGKVDAALESLENACQVVPELPEVHNYKGEVLMSVGRAGEAVAKFNEASRADDKCALPLLNRGVLFMQGTGPDGPSQADLAEAAALFNQAVQVDPTCEIAYAHRASYYFHLSQFDRACEEYATAVKLAKTKMDAAEYCGLKAVCASRIRAMRRLEG